MISGSLRLSGVRIRRERRLVLQIDHLEIPPGVFAGVIGANGAGKTTLLKVCAGLIRPDRGAVLLDDDDLTRLSGWQRCVRRRHIGYIPQSAEYNAELPFTVREVVAMGRTSVRPLLAPLGRTDYAIVDRWLEALGLADRRSQTFRTLSGGEQQKALIARAMAQEPRILMLDEPCASLDFNWRHQISEIIERLYRQTGMTVLMVSHDTSVLPQACQRVILLARGQVLADGAPEDALSPDMLRRAYQGELEAVTVGGRRHIINLPASSTRRRDRPTRRPDCGE